MAFSDLKNANPLTIAMPPRLLTVLFSRKIVHMNSTIKKLLYLDHSPARQGNYLAIADPLGLEIMLCPEEGCWSELNRHCDTLAVLIIGPETHAEDCLRLIEHIRLSPFHASLPIALVLAERDTTIAVQAMDAGITEIFLESENKPLQDFVAECVSAFELPALSGKALVVEDDEDSAEYVASLCQSLGFEVTLTDEVEQAIEWLEKTEFQIVITDIVLKGTKSGLTLLRHIRQQYGAQFPVIVTSGFDDLPRRLMALKNGAGDFISKPFLGEEFIWRAQRVMQLAAKNEATDAAGVNSDTQPGMRNDIRQLLSPREYEIFLAMIKGNSDKEIAARLGISYWTVRTHVQQIFAKTGAINRRELMARCITPGSQPCQ